MATYDFKHIEKKWQLFWEKQYTNKAEIRPNQKKCFVLDMFPYPSGVGLHVGHPLGYIASDIYARYQRLQGYNVLHPIGFDAFGLPAEQYALEHGVSPQISTEKNISNFRQQLKNLALSFDWDREVITCDPKYYKWTQWIFLKIFNSWYNRQLKKAQPIEILERIFEKEGNIHHPFPNEKIKPALFSAEEWKNYSHKEKQDQLMHYRLAYLAHTDVNWCEALGTVLANDEVINGLSYRGGHPVVKKKMQQWNLRISEYADRLLEGLEKVDFSPSMKEMQRNWIGKSLGAEIYFLSEHSAYQITVFSTRPDTIFGADFLVLAPEHHLVSPLTTADKKSEVEEYLNYVSKRSEVERMSEVKKITGCFLGSYAIHPFTGKKIPIWIGEYVLAHYGTGAIMAVPAGDTRDLKFAHHFHIQVTNIFGDKFNGNEAVEDKNMILQNSDFLTGKKMTEAIPIVIAKMEDMHIGKSKINFKMRDAGWSRQRYWGEPFPIYYDEHDVVVPLQEHALPLTLPPLHNFHPTGTGEGPLAHLQEWVHPEKNKRRDTNTMPTHAGAAWYFLRYMDSQNEKEFASPENLDYWNQVDVYIGGAEHAVAHLLYSRLWVKILFDLGYLNFDEPFKKLINQGKILGDTRLVYRIRGTNQFVSFDKKENYETDALRVDVSLVDGVILDTEGFKNWRPDFKNASFILNDKEKYICGTATEKMSKSYFNVVNPDALIEKYGTDTFRVYEMFMGPLEENKPWDTKNMEGSHRFLKRVWNILHNEEGQLILEDNPPTNDELYLLHKTIKKVQEDMERFSFNTVVSTFMTFLNDMYRLECRKKKNWEPFLIMLSPFAPHIAEEIWAKMGHQTSILFEPFPIYDEALASKQDVVYVFCINGKKRADVLFPSDASEEDIKHKALINPNIQKWLEGKDVKKIIFVKHKMINFVV